MTDTDNSQLAASLKEAGNRLFTQKDYKAAHEQYTKAIALDPQNAILWANRSACHLALKQYLDACGDAVEATRIDPTYYKACARLATAQDALQEYLPSTLSWQGAIDAMPTENLTPVQQRQREEYTERLAEAKLRLKIKSSNIGGPDVRIYGDNEGGQPWDIAAEMVEGLRRSRTARSSAWVVNGASKLFDEGVRRMKTAKIRTNENGEPGCARIGCSCMQGEEGALSLICNAILRESRIVHLDDMDNWIMHYNRCGTFERQRHNPWLGLGPDSVKRDAPTRLAEKGWVEVRPDIDLTIRFWIIRGLLERLLDNNTRSELEYCRQALNVIEWGRNEFKDVPLDDKGEVFSDIFLRSVRNYYLKALLTAYGDSAKTAGDRREYLETALEHANLILEDLKHDEGPTEPLWIEGEEDPGYFLSFYDYCKGHAYSIKAFYHSDLAVRAGSDRAEMNRQNKEAAELYLLAAECYPTDDEDHAKYLSCALQHFRIAGALTLRNALDFMGRARQSHDVACKIWSVHPSRRGTKEEQSYQNLVNCDNALRAQLRMLPPGSVDLDAPVVNIG
ncbi:TPR-like protein [Hymenopellis radicata]|nr:TPR-like protein [Hymenopellis radicata]